MEQKKNYMEKKNLYQKKQKKKKKNFHLYGMKI